MKSWAPSMDPRGHSYSPSPPQNTPSAAAAPAQRDFSATCSLKNQPTLPEAAFKNKYTTLNLRLINNRLLF